MNVLQDAFEQRLINLVDFLEICFHFDIKGLLINVKEDLLQSNKNTFYRHYILIWVLFCIKCINIYVYMYLI